jgi:acyl-CoA thioesterase FadM
MIFNQKILNSKTGIEYVDGDVEVCFINLLTKKPQKFPDDLLLIFK